jgi:dephospho-CoA kinase
MSQKIILGIAGEIASGKDTVSKILREKYGAETVMFSGLLRDILDRLYLEQSREHLSRLSLHLRKAFGEDTFSRVILRDAEKLDAEIIVVDGVRRLADIIHFESMGNFHFAYVNASPEKRHERIVARGQNTDDSTKTVAQLEKDQHLEAEAQVRDLRERAEFMIDNNGTLEELEVQVDEVVRKLRKA